MKVPSIEPDRRARDLHQIVGQPSGASSHETVQVDLMHSIKGSMTDLRQPAFDEGAMKKSVLSQTAVRGVIPQGNQASHILELEFVRWLIAGDVSCERAGEEQALLSGHLRRGR